MKRRKSIDEWNGCVAVPEDVVQQILTVTSISQITGMMARQENHDGSKTEYECRYPIEVETQTEAIQEHKETQVENEAQNKRTQTDFKWLKKEKRNENRRGNDLNMAMPGTEDAANSDDDDSEGERNDSDETIKGKQLLPEGSERIHHSGRQLHKEHTGNASDL